MNLIILDKQTKAILYGHQALKAVIRNQKTEQAEIYLVQAETWIAALEAHFSHLQEVKAYLNVVDKQGINPDGGKLLGAIDDVIDIDADDARLLFGGLKQK